MKNLFLIVIALLSFILIGCNEDDDSSMVGTAKVELRLTDAPAQYEEVNIDVQKIVFKMNGDDDIHFPLENPGIYNLLELNNGIDVLLGETVLPVGSISQIRLILGENNTIKVDGVVHPLHTPSAQQSGLKVNVHYTLEPDMVYQIWLDFDAGKSIVERGNGTYGLKPVIRAFTDLTNGMIEGIVLPQESLTTVYAIQNTQDTVAVAIPNPDGYFRFSGLEEGVYDLNFNPANPVFESLDINDVQVTFGTSNNLETIIMQLQTQ